MNPTQIRDFLREKLHTADSAAELFNELGYADAQNAPVPLTEWSPGARAIGVQPRYLAQHGDFKIILITAPLTRTQQRQIVEQIARQHPFFLAVFYHANGEVWEFVNVRTGDSRRVLRRITIGKPERQHNRLYTIAQQMAKLDISAARTIDVNALKQRHDEAFDVEQVTKAFYDQYVEVFDHFADDIRRNNPLDAPDEARADAYAQILLNRLMFLYFIQRKGWLNEEYDYLYRRFTERAPGVTEPGSGYFTDAVLPLFRRLSVRTGASGGVLPGEQIPFLNGGLFQFPDDDPIFQLKVSDAAFRTAFDSLFERYTFTVEEDMPDDRAVAIDPEMLGKVFERLVLSREQERDLRKGTGSYYTPREIVQFMCQHSLGSYLAGKLPDHATAIAAFVPSADASAITDTDQARALRRLLLEVRVIDPAVGSGAFLVGMLQEIVRLVAALDARIGEDDTEAHNYAYNLKKKVISRALYGVDLQAEAVQICELRLWLSLVVDFEPQTPDQPIALWINEIAPLPNLGYLVRQGNSLIDDVMGEPFYFDALRLSYAISKHAVEAITELQGDKAQYFSATDPGIKARLDQQILEKQSSLTKKILEIQREQADEALIKAFPNIMAGMGKPLTAKQTRERAALQEQVDHINVLIARADAIRREVAPTRQPSHERIRELRAQLGGFIWRVDFGEVFAVEMDGRAGGFDIAIANPPYVRQERLSAIKPQLKARFNSGAGVYSGTADLYVYFYQQALRLLRPDGVLTFISSNKFMRAGYGEGLRKLLAERTTLDLLIDFGDLPVFDATAYPVIVGARHAAPPPDHAARILTVTAEADIARVGNLAATAATMPQRDLRAEGWQLESAARRDLGKKLREAGVPLGEYVGGKIYYGIKTGLNEAFEIDAATRARLIAEDPRSAEVIKPWLRGRDIKRWRADQTLYAIIIPSSSDKGVHHSWANMTEDQAYQEFRRRYPAIAAHLSRFKTSLVRRADQGRFWWELRSCAYMQTFSKVKIIFPDIGLRPSFTLDTHYFMIGNTSYLIDSDEVYLIGVLNSNTVEYFYSHLSPQIQNGYYRFIRQYVETIPIPTPTPDIRARIEAVVRDLLAVRGQGESAAGLEAELNRLVYQVYGLTPDEIALIEGGQPADSTAPREQTMQEIIDQHPNQWVAVEVTETDPVTRRPVRGIVRAAGEQEQVADAVGSILVDMTRVLDQSGADKDTPVPLSVFHTDTVPA